MCSPLFSYPISKRESHIMPQKTELTFNNSHNGELNTVSHELDGITGVILAGGASSRMGRNKALLAVDGQPLIARIHHTLMAIFREVIIVTNTPELYDFIPCRKVPDVFIGAGSIAGLHSALVHSPTERVFVVGCDMPSLKSDLIRYLCAVEGTWDAVVPANDTGRLEPLHALYARTCINEMQKALEQGNKSIFKLFDRLRTRKVEWDEIKEIKGALASFCNVNTPQEYGEAIREPQGAGSACVAATR